MIGLIISGTERAVWAKYKRRAYGDPLGFSKLMFVNTLSFCVTQKAMEGHGRPWKMAEHKRRCKDMEGSSTMNY